jgi:RHS repeat-associated protein
MTTNPETNEVLDEQNYYAFGMEMTGNWLKDKGRASNYRYNGKELNEELGLYDYGARWYDPAIGRWNAVDPLADSYASWSPYNYVLGNPIRNTDPDGKSVDDIIIRTRDDKGNYNTALVIESDLVDLTIDVDFKLDDVISNSEGKGISSPFPVIRNVSGTTFDEFLKRGGGLPDAYSIDIEAEAAPGAGIGGELSFTHFLSGPDKGNVYLYAQVNGLAGIEGGAGISFNSYYSDIPERDFDRNTLQGPERGLSGSVGGYEVSRFVGLSFSGKSTSPYFTESPTYHGYSVGASFGSDTAASGSAYFGYAKLMGKLFSF